MALELHGSCPSCCLWWPNRHLEAHLPAGVATGQGTASSHSGGVLRPIPRQPWQTLDSRTFPLIGPPFNKIKGQRELTVLPCLLFTSGSHFLGTSVPPGLSLVCKIQQSQMCRAVGWRTEETEAHKIQFLNFSRFCCFLPSLFQCALSTLNALRAFQHRGQSPRSPCHKKYFLCHFPVSHTPGRMTRSRDEVRPYKAQGRSMYNYFISIQQAIQHFISNL